MSDDQPVNDDVPYIDDSSTDSTDDEEEMQQSFTFQGRSYDTYEEMVEAKRERNRQRLLSSGLLQASAQLRGGTKRKRRTKPAGKKREIDAASATGDFVPRRKSGRIESGASKAGGFYADKRAGRSAAVVAGNPNNRDDDEVKSSDYNDTNDTSNEDEKEEKIITKGSSSPGIISADEDDASTDEDDSWTCNPCGMTMLSSKSRCGACYRRRRRGGKKSSRKRNLDAESGDTTSGTAAASAASNSRSNPIPVVTPIVDSNGCNQSNNSTQQPWQQQYPSPPPGYDPYRTFMYPQGPYPPPPPPPRTATGPYQWNSQHYHGASPPQPWLGGPPYYNHSATNVSKCEQCGSGSVVPGTGPKSCYKCQHQWRDGMHAPMIKIDRLLCASSVADELCETESKNTFDQGSNKNDQNWRFHYDQLLHFKEQFRHCNVPTPYEYNPQLAQWVRMQRMQYQDLKLGKYSPMTEERIDMLESIGFEWSK